MRATSRAAVFVLFAMLAGGGCGTSPTTSGAPYAISTGLVMSSGGAGHGEAAGGPAWRVDPDGWEYARNDEQLNAGRAPLIDRHGWAEIRTRDRTRTSDGRTKDFSTTLVRTYRLRSGS